jgi:hypothetical protein
MANPHKRNRQSKDAKKDIRTNGRIQNKMLHSGIGRGNEHTANLQEIEKISIIGRRH